MAARKLAENAVQGQSAATVDKQRCIAAALSLCMRVFSYKSCKYAYWHFDANAGCGWNNKVNVPGTPLVFWSLANKLIPEMNVNAFFSEVIKESTLELQQRLMEVPRAIENSSIIPGDNAEAIEVFAECLRRSGEVPHYMAGSLIVDPNGYFYRNKQGMGVPIEQLIAFMKVYERIDLILNLNTRTFGMQRPHGHKVLPPLEVFDLLNKKHGLLSVHVWWKYLLTSSWP